MGTHLSSNNAQPCAPPGSGLSTQLRSRSFLEPTFACFNITSTHQHLFPRSRSSRKTLYFLFLAVTRKYAFPLRPLANQNQSAFQHLFQTDLGRSFPHELLRKGHIRKTPFQTPKEKKTPQSFSEYISIKIKSRSTAGDKLFLWALS